MALQHYRRNYANMQGMKISTRILGAVALAIAAAILYAALYQLPAFGDWTTAFYPAILLDNPYDSPVFLVPPWTLLILRPFRLLPEHVAGAAWVLLSIGIILYSARQLGADRASLALILSNPFTWFFITLGQLDALVLLGFVLMRPPYDVLLLTIKPHVIGTAVLFRLREYGRRDWLVLAVVIAGSLLIWWAWPVQMLTNWLRPGGVYHPLSLDIWPYGVPVGLALLYVAWRRDSATLGALSMYFLTPYVGPGSIIVYATLVFSRAPVWVRVVFYAALWALTIGFFL